MRDALSHGVLSIEPSAAGRRESKPARIALPRWARRGVALALVLAAAKALLVGARLADGTGRALLSPWTPAAFLYQDLLVAAAFVVMEAAVSAAIAGRSRPRAWAERGFALGYAALAFYAGLNVPIARVASTPLTYSMLAATRAELADSIVPYITAGNIASLGALAALAALLPRWVGRLRVPARRTAIPIAAALTAILAAGPAAQARVESIGMHRNALVALLTTTAEVTASSSLSLSLSLRAGAGSHDASTEAVLPPLPPEGEGMDLRHLRSAGRGRNVIWVLLESTGARYLAPYGAARDPMPRLTAFTRDSLQLDHAYSAYPMSIPGLFSMLCSSAPPPHAKVESLSGASRPCPSIASQLGAAGYRASLVHSGRFVYLGMRGVVENRGFDSLVDAADIGGKYAVSFGVDEASAVRRALADVDSAPAGKPFFLLYSNIAGHHPYRSPGEGPRPFGTSEPLDAYASDLYRGDAALGELIDGIAARGLSENTLWIITGDHGEAFQQHEGNFGHAMFVYEENIHVPLFVVAPGLLHGRTRAPQIASLIDIAPTLLELLGLPVPRAYEGRSFLGPEPGAARFFADQVTFLAGVRSGPWKLVHDLDTGRSKLFDLRSDPGEQLDLSAGEPGRTAELTAHVRAWALRSSRQAGWTPW
jgi:phosphoglycerol transferase MdoB-like AlkP superfamily enzyme